jgi:hypothetical protein
VSSSAWVVVGGLGAVALLHVYWALGGRFFTDAVIPTRHTPLGLERIFNPSPLAALIVAGYLAAIVGLAYAVSQGETVLLTPLALRVLLGIAGTIFLLRAIGDFRYMGFFKRVHGTPFAWWDTRLFSPFILLIGAACLAVALG